GWRRATWKRGSSSMKMMGKLRLPTRTIRSDSRRARREPSEPSNATAMFRSMVSLICRGHSFAIQLNFGTAAFRNKELLGNKRRDYGAENYDCDQHRILTLRNDLILQAKKDGDGAESQSGRHQHRSVMPLPPRQAECA